jgi:hypothetical protein
VSQESLWLWRGDSSGNREKKRPPLEAGTREPGKGHQTERT